MVTCVNCQMEYNSNFCPNCGQKKDINPISFSGLFDEIQDKFIGFDNRFFRTIKDMFLRPGDVAREYIKGNRRKYMAPVGFYILMITAFLLAFPLLGLELSEVMSQTSAQVNTQAAQNQPEFMKAYMELVSRNMKVFSALLLPILALFAKLFFKKAKYSFLEHFVFFLYLSGTSGIIGIVFTIFHKVSGMPLTLFQMFFGFVFFIYCCINFYNQYKTSSTIFRSVFFFISTYFVYGIIMMVIAGAYLGYTHPELFKNFGKPKVDQKEIGLIEINKKMPHRLVVKTHILADIQPNGANS